MKFFLDEDNINVVQTIASASTLISSLAGIIQNYVVSRFPKDFFKSIYMDTSQTINEQKKNDFFNLNLNKKKYPSLAITPELSLDDPIGGMEKNIHISSPNLFLKKEMNRNYNTIALDPEQKFSLYFTSDYITTNFNFKIVTNSFVQNADLAFFLKSNFQEGFFQFLNDQYLQTEIPKTFIKIISELKNFNLFSSDDLDRLRLFLIDIGRQEQNIEKKVNLMTGKTSFFLDNKNNMLMLFSDLDCPPSIIRENQVEGEYTINFRVQLSAWLPNSFIMSIKKSIFDSLETQIETSTEEQDSGFFTISLKNKELLRKKIINFSDDFGKTQIGQLVASEVFTRNLNDNFENLEINFLKNMKSDFLDIFAYAEEKLSKEQISQLVKIKLFSNEGEASSDIFSVGKHLVITIKKNILSDFVIDAFVNRSLFESLKKAKESDTLFINSGFLTSLLIRTDENSNLEKVIVKRFSGNKEFFESDSNKMFRIQTNYGIGYISLDYDGRKKNSDLYRICVGYDNNDQPIIKFLNF